MMLHRQNLQSLWHMAADKLDKFKLIETKNISQEDNGRGVVGRPVASDTSHPRFESTQ